MCLKILFCSPSGYMNYMYEWDGLEDLRCFAYALNFTNKECKYFTIALFYKKGQTVHKRCRCTVRHKSISHQKTDSRDSKETMNYNRYFRKFYEIIRFSFHVWSLR